MFISGFTSAKDTGILVHAVPLQIFNVISHNQLYVKTKTFTSFFPLFPPFLSYQSPASQTQLV